jgi:uncharacterized protein YkwD
MHRADAADRGAMARRITLSLLLAGLGALACGTASASATSLIAPPTVCGQPTEAAPIRTQEQAMLCMTNYARSHAGLNELAATSVLEESAHDKSRDILRCDEFSHYACGREFTYWMRATGYLAAQCWRAGENLAWGIDEYGTVSSIFRAWMHSPDHRANILGSYTQIGIDLQSGELEGRAAAHVWTQHFGSHCEAS